MMYRKAGEGGGHEGADLRHYDHEGYRADVGAFAGHVAAGYDLEAFLGGGVDVVGDVFCALDGFFDGVAGGLEGEC